MGFIREALARVAGVFTKNRGDDDLRDELRAHLEMQIEEFVRRGMDPAEARRQALLAAGGVTFAVESVREQRGIPWLESIAADIRYAARSLMHSKGFAAVVILTLALGIGANTAIFSVLNGVLFKPLPNRDGDRLLHLRQSNDQEALIKFSVPEVRDLRAGVPALAGGIAEYSPWFGVLRGDNDAVRVDIGLVTGNFFQVMGLAPVVGRLTGPANDGPGVPQVVVLSHEFWMRRYGGDPGIVGKKIDLTGQPTEVLGVLQEAPFFPSKVDVFTNMVVSPHHLGAQMQNFRTHRMTEAVARLAPGATLEEAENQVASLYSRFTKDYPEAYDPGSHYRMALVPFKEALGERAQLTVWLLMVAAGFMMIISAANVANLTLMRGVRREHELVVRAALGAGVGRLRRMLLVENLMLTLIGAAAGVFIARSGTTLLVGLAARYSPRSNEIGLDFTVFGFTLAMAVAIAMLMSWVATLPRDGAFAQWIASGARRMTGGVRKQRLQRVLVIAQVAVSVVLMAGAGLLTRTLIHLSDVNTGLKTEDILAFPLDLVDPTQLMRDLSVDARVKALYAQIHDDVRALPGVVDVGVGSPMPLRSSPSFQFKVDGKVPAPGEPTWVADLRTADPTYFSAAGIPLLQGRAFTSNDRTGSPFVVIVNQRFVDKFFPGEDPIGKRMAWDGPVLKFTPFSGEWRTIVGVVGNTQDGGLDARQHIAVFVPFAQELAMGGGLVIRADSNVTSLAAAATRLARRAAPGIPIEPPMTIAQYKRNSVAARRLNAILVSSFGGLALLIASVGIAGVLAFSVSARTNEIGIRMSLGAERGTVQRMILKEGGSLVVVGVVLGVLGAWAGSGFIQGLLFGVAPNDPATYLAVVAVMAVIGIVACWIPARRASQVDPVITMRAS